MNTRRILVAVAALPLMAACNPGQSEPVDKAQDAMAAPVGQMSASTVGQGVEGYVTAAAMGDMYEIAAADIALERSENSRVRELAEMLKTDHTAASEQMKTLVPQAAPGVTLPTALDQRHQGLIDNLRSADAASFDQTFMSQQVAAHEEALTLHQGFSDNTEAPQLAEHARTVAPKIKMHLDMASAGSGEAAASR